MWIAPAVLAGQVLAIYATPASALPYVLVAAHLALLPALLSNLRSFGMRLVLAGLSLNLLVMVTNGGLMPVELNAVEAVGKHHSEGLQLGEHIPGSKNVLLDRDNTKLWLLSDVIILPTPQPFTRAISIGDVTIMGGLGLLAVSLIRRVQRRHHV